MFLKFKKSDLFINRVKAHPKVEFFLNSGSIGSVYYQREEKGTQANVPDGHVGLGISINNIILPVPSGSFIITEGGDFLISEGDAFIITED